MAAKKNSSKFFKGKSTTPAKPDAGVVPSSHKKSAKKKPGKAKEAEPTVPAQNEGVGRWMARMNKDRSLKGKAEIRFASQVSTPFNLRRPTGILGLDIALGGGFAAGGEAEIHGAESSGKTFLLNLTCGSVQRIYGPETAIAIFSTELRPDKGYMRLAGFCVAYSDDEIGEMEGIRAANELPPFTSEELVDLRTQIGDVVIVTASTAETGFDVVIEGLREGIFQIIAIDSLGALLTAQVDEGDVGDSHYAGAAKIVTQFQNKVYPLFTMSRPDGKMLETTLIGINQMRANVGASKFEDKDKPGMGAWAWRHGQLVNLGLEKGPKLYEGEKGKSPVVGRTVRWDIVKGKAGTHDGKKGDYGYWHFERHTPVFWKDCQEYFLGGPLVYDEIVQTAKELGVIELAGSWYSWSSLDEKFSHRCQGPEGMAQFFASNSEAEEAVRKQCLREAGLLVRYR